MKYYSLTHGHGITSRFYTRNGGVGEGLFSSLSFNRKYDTENCERNKDLLRIDLGVESLCFLDQQHTSDVVTVRSEQDFGVVADASVTNIPGIGLVVLTADCCPILFYDVRSKVIGAAHAGWRGALSGVIANTVDAMCALGAERSDIVMCIGPTIRKENYEVGAEFYDAFISKRKSYERFFEAKSAEKFLFDLPAFCRFLGEESHLGRVYDTLHDTYSNEQDFFSCRRAFHRGEPYFGNMASCIALA